ncbi:MAG: phosphonate C-P lyase system protein PhnH [Halobacteria archaeon]|nr:phosphonate C-P lyase system protein PhnH [Halobacteria archaeon]
MTDNNLQPGFDNPVLDSQYLFRQLLNAFSHPGMIEQLDESVHRAPVNKACYAICLTMVDYETPLWLDEAAMANDKLVDFFKFHCGSPLVTKTSEASFALVITPGELPPLAEFNQGEVAFPDRSATLIVQVSSLETGSGWCLSGPGIKDHARLQVVGLPERFLSDWQDNHAVFPLGVDLILTCDTSFAALPRTTIIQ